MIQTHISYITGPATGVIFTCSWFSHISWTFSVPICVQTVSLALLDLWAFYLNGNVLNYWV